MKLNSIRWRLTLSYAAIALLAAFSLGLVLRGILRDYYDRQEERYLQSRAREIGAIASQLLDAGLPEEIIREQSRSWAFFLQARVRLYDTSGNLVADSGMPQAEQMLFITSAEPFTMPAEPIGESNVQAVKRGPFFQIQILRDEVSVPGVANQDVIVFNSNSVGVALPVDRSMNGLLEPGATASTRRSDQVVEQPIQSESGEGIGRVTLSDGPAYGDEIINNVMNGWITAGLAAVALAALAGWFMSERVTRPVLALENATRQMEQGNLSVRVDLQNESQQEFVSLAHSFNGMAEQVEQTVSTLREFVADAAHELHTPLTALQANIELARDEENASERTRYLTRAQEQGQRLEAMVESLLGLSRIEAAESRSSFELVDFIPLVREVGEQFASRAEQAERTFSMTVSEDELKVLGNEMQLKQVVMNLLENALKFTPARGTISLDLERDKSDLLLTVSDFGIGIPPEDLPQLFERFHRGRNVAAYPGNGLGLAIVKAIVDSHSGHVEAHSTGHEQGSRFIVRIPLA
jgi:signal transduction histidine kinase